MERIPENVDSKFRFVLLASHRAEQIMRGADLKLEQPFFKHTRSAMEEIITEKVKWEYGPERPEADEHGLIDGPPPDVAGDVAVI